MTGKKLAVLICTVVSVLLFESGLFAQTTFKSGSAIIDMGSATPTVKNSLKPYGLIYALLKNNHVPVSYVVNAAKVKDGIDFTYNAKAYKGGTFIISAEYISTEVSNVIASWASQGVLIDYTNSDLTVSVTQKIGFVPKWVMDKTNGSIAVAFLNAAGIPSSAYTFKTPAQLDPCDDIFVMPHADPTWATHGNLFDWNKNNKGNIWAGCHAVSVLENMVDPFDALRKTNFLSTTGLVPFTDHNPVSAPFQYNLPGDPVGQFYNKTDAAQTNGSENVYLPKLGGGWNTGAKILSNSPSQIDIPVFSPGAAAQNIYGRAFDDPTRGFVAYQASHNIGGAAGTADQIAAQRIFFNFSLFALSDKIPPIITANLVGTPPQLTAGTTSGTFDATPSGTGTGFTYQWSANVAGTFSAPNAAQTTFTPSNTITSSTSCIVKVVVTESCGRVSFESKKITIVPPPGGHTLTNLPINKNIPDGCATGSITFNVFDNNPDPGAGPRTLVSVTGLGNGSLITSTNGDVTFTANANFKGATNGTFIVTNGVDNSPSANITITVGDATKAPVVATDALTAIVDNVTTINVLANDANGAGATGTGGNAGLYIKNIVQRPGKGEVYINTNGTLSYLSNKDQATVGADVFQYLACNSDGYCSVGTVNVTLLQDACAVGSYQLTTTGTVAEATFTATKDSYIQFTPAGNGPTTNAGAATTVQMNGLTNNPKRPIIQFDLSTITATATINVANLSLTNINAFTPSATTSSFPATVSALTRTWTEGSNTGGLGIHNDVTWVSATTGISWTTAGGDFTTTGSAQILAPNDVLVAANAVLGTSLINMVTNWTNGTIANNGLLIVPTTLGSSPTVSFFPKTNASNGPKLYVNYTTPAPCSTIPTNYKPFVYPTSATTSSALSVTINPTLNLNYYGRTNQVTGVTVPAHGTATFNGTQVIYTPNGSFVGTDTLTFTVTDTDAGNLQTNTTTIFVTVTRVAPTVLSDVATTPSNTAKTIVVGANDNDAQGGMGAPVIVTAPAKGTVSINGTDIIYTPSNGFTGTDIFTYSRTGAATDVCSIALSGTATVTVTVTNQTPVANAASISTFSCAPVTIDLLSISSDAEGGALSVTITSNPASGTLSAVGAGKYQYTPNNGHVGTDNFAYTVTDPLTATSVAATVSITVSGVANPNTAPIAVNDKDSTLMGQVVYTNVIGNDSDPNSDPLSISITGTGLLAPVTGTLALMPNKLIRYTPPAGFTGEITYQYRLSDTHPGCSGSNSLDAVATVTIKVTAIPTTLSGTVINDINVSAAGTFTNISSPGESGTNANGSIYVYLVDNSNIVKDRTPVNADGTYLLSDVPSLTPNLKLLISIEDISAGNLLTATSLPNGYVNSTPLSRALSTTTSADMGGYDWGIYTNPVLSAGIIVATGDICGTSGVPPAINSTANATGGSLTATRYKYQWQLSTVSASAGFTNTSLADSLTSLTPSASITTTTWYRRSVTTKNLSNIDIDATVFSNVVTVTVSPKPTVIITPVNATIGTGLTTTFTASGADTYIWSPSTNLNASNTATVIAGPLTATTAYTVTGTISATGCNNTATITITVINPGQIGSDQNNCGAFTPTTLSSITNASGASDITYTWASSTASASTGFTVIPGATAVTYSPSGITATTYFRRIATSGGTPFNSNVVTMTVSTNPTVIITPTNATIGTGLTTTFTASGANTYTWSPSTNLSASNTATVIAGPLTATTAYTVTGTISATGCNNTATISITVINPGQIGSDQNNCGAFTPTTLSSVTDASGTTGITYTWEISTTSTTTGFATIGAAVSSTYTPAGITATTYYRRVATSGGLHFYSNVITATVKTIPTAAAGNNSPLCAGGTLNLTASGGTGYSWTGPNGFISNTQNPSIPSVTAAASGTYTVQVTGANGCTSVANTAVTIHALPTITISPSSATINEGENVALTAGGAGTYSWTPATNLSATNTAAVTATPVSTATYTVTGTITSTGCTNTTSVVVTIVPVGGLVPGFIGSDLTICSNATPASFTSTAASGGTGTINYQWQSSTDNTTFTNIAGATAATYGEGAITQTTYYRRGASTSTNTVVYSNTVKVTVQLSVSGTISGGGISVCTNVNSGTLTLTGHIGSVLRWESSTNGFSTVTTITNTANTQAFTNIATTTQYRAVVQLGTCAVVTSSPVTVTTRPLPVIGAIAGPCALARDSIKTFLVAPVPNATGYIWQLPSGWTGSSTTNSIDVKAGVSAGMITVTAVNTGCSGISSTASIPVTIIDYAQVTIIATPTIASGNLTSTMAITVQLFDINGNVIHCSGGIATLCSNIPSATFSTVVDNLDGTYSSFLSSAANNIKICGTVGGIPISKTTNVEFTGPQGGIKGNGPILDHEVPKLTFTFTAGTAPYTVIYRSAKSNKNDTLTNVISGKPISVPFIPSTTLYTLLGIIDANGERRIDNFNRDTATIIVLAPKIIVTLKSDAPVLDGDSTWKTRLSLHVKNIGDLDLNDVQVKLNLKDVFPSPVTYVLDSVRVNGRTIVQNPNYDGVQHSDLFAALQKKEHKLPADIRIETGNENSATLLAMNNTIDGVEVYGNKINDNTGQTETEADDNRHSVFMFGPASQLPINVDGFMYLYLHIKPNGHYEPFVMQAVALGTGRTEEGAALATSLSNDNENTAAHPDITQKGDPLPTVINLIPTPVIGVSLSASTPVDQGNGTYHVTLSYKLRNYGNVNLQSVQLYQNLARMIGSPSTFTLVGGVITTGTLLPNPSFDAKLDSNMLLPLSELGMGLEGTLKFTINITPNKLSALYRLQAQANAVFAEINLPTSDLSTDGGDPDPDANKIPTERVLTLIVINQPIPPLVPPGIGINIDAPGRTTVLTKNYCASAVVRNIPTGVPTGGSGPYEFQWQRSTDNLAFTDIAGANDSVYTTTTLTASVYLRMKVISDNQVAFTNTVHIVISPLPAKPVITGTATQVVGTGNIALRSSVANAYVWSNGAAARDITATGAGSYSVTITDNNGCTATSDAYVITALDPYKVADVLKKLTKAPELQSDGSFIMNFRVYASNLRAELLDSVRIKDDLTKVFPSSTQFEVTGIQASGNLVANNLYNGNSNIEMLANGSQLPGMKTDSVQIAVKVFSNGFAGTLHNTAELTGKSPYGVFKIASNDPTVGNGTLVRSPTPFTIPAVDLFIPSGFSPNRDGTNDLFVITRPFNTSINLEVFNRWGNLVYRNREYKNEWGGRGNQPNNILGEELPDGTYYYIVLATDKTTGSVRKFAGFITLKR